QSPLAYRPEIITLVVLLVLIAIGPTLFFWPRLVVAKRQGQIIYGRLATDYCRRFHEKWIDGHRQESDELLGTGDIQSLADLGNSFGFIALMRQVTFGTDLIVNLAVAVAAPLAPLVLAIIPLEELVNKLVSAVL